MKNKRIVIKEKEKGEQIFLKMNFNIKKKRMIIQKQMMIFMMIILFWINYLKKNLSFKDYYKRSIKKFLCIKNNFSINKISLKVSQFYNLAKISYVA